MEVVDLKNEGWSTLRFRTSSGGEQPNPANKEEARGGQEESWNREDHQDLYKGRSLNPSISDTPRGKAERRPKSWWNSAGKMKGGRGGRFGPLAALAAVGALAVLLPVLLVQHGAPQAQDAARTAAAVHSPAAGQAGGRAEGSGRQAAADPEQSPVRVYLTHTGEVETLPLEEYVTGVLAAEMPADFELAALKAQAIAARTFIARRLAAGDTSGVPGGVADVNDTVSHQAYVSSSALEEWKTSGRGKQLKRLQQAVDQTRGIIMTYQGQPITASFFSSSGGYTENSEDYWSSAVPYLRSVSSPWELGLNPKNIVTEQISLKEVFAKLGQQAPALPAIGANDGSGKGTGTGKGIGADKEIGAGKRASSGNGLGTETGAGKSTLGSSEQAASTGTPAAKLFKVLSVTAGGRVKDIRIGDNTYSGREVREKLDLRSSQFTIELDGSKVKITTYGSGHGVGMSQWGANGMAKRGYTTTQILRHYYTGISFGQISDILGQQKK